MFQGLRICISKSRIYLYYFYIIVDTGTQYDGTG